MCLEFNREKFRFKLHNSKLVSTLYFICIFQLLFHWRQLRFYEFIWVCVCVYTVQYSIWWLHRCDPNGFICGFHNCPHNHFVFLCTTLTLIFVHFFNVIPCNVKYIEISNYSDRTLIACDIVKHMQCLEMS